MSYTHACHHSQLEAELNEKLTDVYNKLMQSNTDQRETERETRLRETLAALQRIFPGVRGRVADLCRPTQRKYETAVATVLGRNIDAVVVDEEKTAIDCIEVRPRVCSQCEGNWLIRKVN